MPRPPYLPIATGPALLIYSCAGLALSLAFGCACPHPAPRTAVELARATAQPSTPVQATASTPTARPTLLPLADLPQLDLEPRLGSYLAQDAVWVPGQPLVVNRDFDFMLAMSLEGGIGAGLAAKKRQDENRALAEQLAALPTIDTGGVFDALCGAAPTACAERADQTVRIYGLLYGAVDAKLVVLLETEGSPTPATRYAVVANEGATAAWNQGDVLEKAFDRAMHDLAASLQLAPAATSTIGVCRITRGSKLEGYVLATNAKRTVLAIAAPPLQVSCPAAVFETPPP